MMEDKDRELLIEMKVSMAFVADNISKLEGTLDSRLNKLEADVNKRLDDQDSQLRVLSKIVYGTPAALIIGVLGLWFSGGVSVG